MLSPGKIVLQRALNGSQWIPVDMVQTQHSFLGSGSMGYSKRLKNGMKRGVERGSPGHENWNGPHGQLETLITLSKESGVECREASMA